MPDNISKYNAGLTAAESSARGRKAGRASGQARRETRRLKDAIIDHMTDDDLGEIIDGLIRRAKRSTRDFEVLRDTIGQKPKDSMTVERTEPIVIRVHNVPRPGEEWDEDGGE